MKNNRRFFTAAVGLWLCITIWGLPALGASIMKPAIYSYYWPISEEQNDLLNWNMQTPTVIDIPQQDNPKWLEAKVYWEKKGKTILYRVHPFKGIKNEVEMYALFVKRLELSKGIAIDEIITRKLTQEQAIMFVNVLKRTRRTFPDSIIAVWCAGDWNSDNTFVLEAVRDNADMFIPELYISQSVAEKKGLGEFKRYLASVEKLAPGIIGKTLVGIGTYPDMADDPSQSFKDHVAAQIILLGTDPFFRSTMGIALYAPVYLPADDQKWIDGVLKKHFSR